MPVISTLKTTKIGDFKIRIFDFSETRLDRAHQSKYLNIIDEPKLDHAPNGMDNSPISKWAVVPFLHIVSQHINNTRTLPIELQIMSLINSRKVIHPHI